jgi:hypothetical protein
MNNNRQLVLAWLESTDWGRVKATF